MTSVAIQCKGISKSYGVGENRVEALKSTDLEIYRGQLTLIVGPSGSGKSTLVSIIATILTADTGKLMLLDQPIENFSELQKAHFRCHNIGIVFQSLFLVPTLTISENVALPLIVSGMDEEIAIEKATKLLDKVHLKHRAHVPPTNLSKGQQQKVAIARSMVTDAPIMILDEPTSALDQVSGIEVMKFLREIIKDSDKAIVVVTHDPRTFPYADRMISMSDGAILPEGTIND